MSKFIAIGKTECKKVDVKRFEYGANNKTVYIFITGKKEPEVKTFKQEYDAKAWVLYVKGEIES